MKYSIPVISPEQLYKEHTGFFRTQLEPSAFGEQIEHVMQKRKVTRNDLMEMTGLSAQRIGTILKIEGSDDPGRHVKRDHSHIPLSIYSCLR